MARVLIIESTEVLIDSSLAKSKAASVVCDVLERNGVSITNRTCSCELEKSRAYVEEHFGLDSRVHDFERLTLGHLLEKNRVHLNVVDFENFLRVFHEARVENAKLYSDVASALNELKRKFKLCLAADGPSWRERKLVSKLGIANLFAVRVYGEEFGLNKSAEAFFKHVLNELKTQALEAVLVTSNAERDVATANKLGITTVLVDRERKAKLSKLAIRPKFLVRNLKEVTKLKI